MRLGNGKHLESEAHPDAEAMLVQDGHLVLSRYADGADQSVAIYAPGNWTSAQQTNG